MEGHWDEELHGIDYLVYAYLQKGDYRQALQWSDYTKGIQKVYPENFKTAYALAAIPCRVLLESRDWEAAAHIETPSIEFPWKDYPWQLALLHYTRGLGAARTDQIDLAARELAIMEQLRSQLNEAQNTYQAGQVEIQMIKKPSSFSPVAGLELGIFCPF